MLATLPGVSRTQVVTLIIDGLVTVDGQVVTKPGAIVSTAASIECDFKASKYVSRAGLKLERALLTFKIIVANKVALDAGLSTGGFTDCLLQHGITKVYGIDVGTNQVHAKIKNDARVVVMEQTNLRHLVSLPEQVDIITLDLSFISVLKVIVAAAKFLKTDGALIVLIKPQFEVGKKFVGNGGIVKEAQIRERAVKTVVAGVVAAGFIFKDVIDSPIMGGDGNQEFLAYFTKA